MRLCKLDEFMVKRGGSVDPSKFKDETFELLSIPAFDQGIPEVVEGEKIGSSKKMVEPRDVLLSKIVPHIRRCWIVPDRSDKRQIASGEWIQFRGNDFFPEYLRLFLISNRFHNQFMKTVKGVGGSLLRASPAQVAEIEIPLPLLDDQIRIAHLLGKVEGLIAQRKQHLQQLDDLLKSAFLEMFGDPVRNEKGWDILPFSQVGKFTSGGTPSKSRDDFWVGKYPWVSPKDMKVPKIFDSEDHISEKVFDETSLKRIAPGHLLIVVRGMILAHSFPVAINMVDVAINQDMKAIKLKSSLRTAYVFYCLTSLKRQILKLITTAGHGTKKFDSDVMVKLLIPVPPLEMQDKFVLIADKIEFTKSRYQQSLIDLEALYGTLSQQAFKGELDLSRVPLPSTQPEEEKVAAVEPLHNTPAEHGLVIHLPDICVLLDAVQGPVRQQDILRFWLESYRGQLGSTPFSVQHFMAAVQTRLAERYPDNDFVLGTNDYEHIKAWVFEALAAGKLVQTFDDTNNRIHLKAVQL